MAALENQVLFALFISKTSTGLSLLLRLPPQQQIPLSECSENQPAEWDGEKGNLVEENIKVEIEKNERQEYTPDRSAARHGTHTPFTHTLCASFEVENILIMVIKCVELPKGTSG